SVTMVRMFWTGCGCPSEFRMLWRRPESTVPATVTTSRKDFHRKVFPRAGVRNPQVSRPPQRDGYRVPAMLGTLTGLRKTRLFTCAGSCPRHLLPRKDRGRTSPEEDSGRPCATTN